MCWRSTSRTSLRNRPSPQRPRPRLRPCRSASPRPPAAERHRRRRYERAGGVGSEIGSVGIAGGNRALAKLGGDAERQTERDREEERAAKTEARLGGAGAEERLHEEEAGVARLVVAVLEDRWEPAGGSG